MADGIFQQPFGGGVFRDPTISPPNDPASPTIDSDDTPLRETLVAVYPSPGHMRVARAIRHPKSGKVEFQEQYREPTAQEIELLRQQGVVNVGPGGMVQQSGGGGVSGVGFGGVPLGDAGNPANGTAAVNTSDTGGFPWIKVGLALAAGAAAFWAVDRHVVPLVKNGLGGGGSDDDGDDGDDDDDDFDEPTQDA